MRMCAGLDPGPIRREHGANVKGDTGQRQSGHGPLGWGGFHSGGYVDPSCGGTEPALYFRRQWTAAKNEFSEVLESYKGMGLNVTGVDARQRFYDALSGITDPEAKRK